VKIRRGRKKTGLKMKMATLVPTITICHSQMMEQMRRKMSIKKKKLKVT